VLYTLDGETVRCQQVEGRVDKQKVMRVVSQWVGGQSYPELTFRQPMDTRLGAVKRLQAGAERDCIRLSGGGRVKVVRVEPAQYEFVYRHLEQHCTAAGKN
jgi:hypothetical protein